MKSRAYYTLALAAICAVAGYWVATAHTSQLPKAAEVRQSGGGESHDEPPSGPG